MPPNLRAAVLLAAWCALRQGELAELRRKHARLTEGVLRVERAVIRVNGANICRRPKTEAGTRRPHPPSIKLPSPITWTNSSVVIKKPCWSSLRLACICSRQTFAQLFSNAAPRQAASTQLRACFYVPEPAWPAPRARPRLT